MNQRERERGKCLSSHKLQQLMVIANQAFHVCLTAWRPQILPIRRALQELLMVLVVDVSDKQKLNWTHWATFGKAVEAISK